jgi:hypothetical protein
VYVSSEGSESLCAIAQGTIARLGQSSASSAQEGGNDPQG